MIGKRQTQTGIFKHPVSGKIQVTPLGLANDTIANKVHHGGVDQAVYVYSMEDYTWWSTELGREITPGAFGENLTLSGFGTDELKIGDRFEAEEILLEVTAPRIPCATLATKMGDAGFVKQFRDGCRPGFYARVLKAGNVQANESIKLIPSSTDHPTVVDLFNVWYEKEKDMQMLERLRAAPLAERVRAKIDGWLSETRS